MKKRLRTRNVAVPDRNVSERFQMSLEISNTTFENVQTATVNRFFQELSKTSQIIDNQEAEETSGGMENLVMKFDTISEIKQITKIME